MSKDEYAGYHFESLFTSAQSNCTRHKAQVSLHNPQQGFHSIQFWKFGKFRLLYSNEIDAEIHPSQLDQIDQVSPLPSLRSIRMSSLSSRRTRTTRRAVHSRALICV